MTFWQRYTFWEQKQVNGDYFFLSVICYLPTRFARRGKMKSFFAILNKIVCGGGGVKDLKSVLKP